MAGYEEGVEQESLPSRERGLKLDDRPRRYTTSQVAPFTGAWIEMRGAPATSSPASQSLPSRERGLKFMTPEVHAAIDVSLPSRERGLKC